MAKIASENALYLDKVMNLVNFAK